MTKISIIIPVYDGENYLGRCLDSVINQTFQDVVVLAIDDGSKDGSLSVLEEYQRNYPDKIKVYSQPNSGVAKTRNRGIELVETEYLTFMDQDDFIDEDYCETLYEAAVSTKSDIVLSGFKRPDAGGRIINKNVTLKDTPYARYACMALYAKLHRTAFVKDNHIQVFDTKYGEDIVFILHEYSLTNSIHVIEGYAGYNWVYNEESVSNTSQKKILNMLPALLTLLEKEKEYDSSASPEHEYFALQTIVFFFLWVGRSAQYSDFMSVYGEVIGWLRVNYVHFEKNKYIPFGPSGAPLLNRFAIGIFMLMHKLHMMKIFARVYSRA